MRGATYRPMPDRIEAGTLLAAAAATGGEVELTDAPVEELGAVMAKLREMGCRVEAGAGAWRWPLRSGWTARDS